MHKHADKNTLNVWLQLQSLEPLSSKGVSSPPNAKLVQGSCWKKFLFTFLMENLEQETVFIWFQQIG